MGFLSGLSGILGGGSQSKSTGSTQSGFSLLPSQIQDAYKNYATSLNSQLPNLTSMYTPLPQTADETAGLNQIRQGFTPTAQSLNSDIGMLMNPYQNFVEDPVNRAAASDYSILKQNATQAGQFGSNRQQLGANDIEQTRLSTIGNLRNNAYNTALSSVLNNIIPQRISDASGLLGIGQFQRNLAGQTNQAPITGLQQYGSALGVLPSSGGSTQTQNEVQTKSDNGTAGNLISTIGSIASLFSDRRLKEEITYIGEENGFPIYTFRYIGGSDLYKGVMADDIEKVVPEAVTIGPNGFKMVNYDMIGVEFCHA